MKVGKILSLLVLTGSIFSFNCKSFGNDTTVVSSPYSSQTIPVWSRPTEMQTEVGAKPIAKSVTVEHILWISFSDKYENNITLVLNDNKSNDYVTAAAAIAAEEAKADAVIITSSTRERKGFYPFYYKDTYNFEGRPVFFKSKGLMGQGRFDARRRYFNAFPEADNE